MVQLILVLALVGFLVLSYFLSRGIDLFDYTSFRDKADFRRILFSLLSSLLGGWMFFGLAAVGYEAGVVGYVMGFVYSVGLLIFAKFSTQIKAEMVRLNCDTFDEFMGAKFGHRTQLTVSVVNFCFFVAVLAAQFVAMAALLSLAIDTNRTLLLYGSAAVVIIYTALAGFKGVLITDVWQFWTVGLGVLILSLTLFAHFSLTDLSALPADYFLGTRYGVVFLVGLLIFIPFSMLVRTDLWQRVASARDATAVRFAFVVASPLIFIFYFLLTSAGVLARIFLGPLAQSDTSVLVAFKQLADPTASPLALSIFSLLILGIFAALLSTIDTNLSVISVALSKLLFRSRWEQAELSRRSTRTTLASITSPLLARTRIITVLVGSVGLLFALYLPNIVDLIVSAAAILLIFIPPAIAALWGARLSSHAATISISIGFAVFVVCLVVLPDPKSAFLPGVIASIILWFSLSRHGRPVARPEVDIDLGGTND